jgi:hypothetical protein
MCRLFYPFASVGFVSMDRSRVPGCEESMILGIYDVEFLSFFSHNNLALLCFSLYNHHILAFPNKYNRKKYKTV